MEVTAEEQTGVGQKLWDEHGALAPKLMSHSGGMKEAKNQLKDTVSREEKHERGAAPKELTVGHLVGQEPTLHTERLWGRWP